MNSFKLDELIFNDVSYKIGDYVVIQLRSGNNKNESVIRIDEIHSDSIVEFRERYKKTIVLSKFGYTILRFASHIEIQKELESREAIDIVMAFTAV
ncbi:hypothetical protein [Bacillus cereus]|uniref:hypothetical protein n=1 Tax=Bacillus cereus TaxID=1396 RepID=UPI000B4B44C3|nr:hypothetical protein [Bacillus cereus]